MLPSYALDVYSYLAYPAEHEGEVMIHDTINCRMLNKVSTNSVTSGCTWFTDPQLIGYILMCLCFLFKITQS